MKPDVKSGICGMGTFVVGTNGGSQFGFVISNRDVGSWRSDGCGGDENVSEVFHIIGRGKFIRSVDEEAN